MQQIAKKPKNTLKPKVTQLQGFEKNFEHDKMLAVRKTKCTEPLLLYLLMENDKGYDIMCIDSSKNIQGIRCKHTKYERDVEHMVKMVHEKFKCRYITCFAVGIDGRDIDMYTIDKRNINNTDTVFNIVS
jgi:hypothetical protein